MLPIVCGLSSVAAGSSDCSQPCLRSRSCSVYQFLVILSMALSSFLLCTCKSVLSKNLEHFPPPRPSQPRSLEHALRRNHISGIISYEFQLVGLFLSNADLCFLNLVRSPESAVKSPFLLSGEKFLLSIYLSNHRAHPVSLFFKMIILCCLLYSVIFNIFFCFLSCLCQVVKCYLNISFIA